MILPDSAGWNSWGRPPTRVGRAARTRYRNFSEGTRSRHWPQGPAILPLEGSGSGCCTTTRERCSLGASGTGRIRSHGERKSGAASSAAPPRVTAVTEGSAFAAPLRATAATSLPTTRPRPTLSFIPLLALPGTIALALRALRAVVIITLPGGPAAIPAVAFLSGHRSTPSGEAPARHTGASGSYVRQSSFHIPRKAYARVIPWCAFPSGVAARR